jgi:hypothetical protein
MRTIYTIHSTPILCEWKNARDCFVFLNARIRGRAVRPIQPRLLGLSFVYAHAIIKLTYGHDCVFIQHDKACIVKNRENDRLMSPIYY